MWLSKAAPPNNRLHEEHSNSASESDLTSVSICYCFSYFTAGHFHNIYQSYIYRSFTDNHINNIYQSLYNRSFTDNHIHNIYQSLYNSYFTAGHFHNIYQSYIYSDGDYRYGFVDFAIH
ncbi:hypothetical protein DPX16_23504 [Anabarilius grahami]|uniref:Uncharacterized protein n=1 Tax=Anabarilius grahami TaxID=495550 RepID=A0A3N0Z172_ANAGA|nr:hypothetical protein DPX16_23504 [Anabarilius grahami]